MQFALPSYGSGAVILSNSTIIGYISAINTVWEKAMGTKMGHGFYEVLKYAESHHLCNTTACPFPISYFHCTYPTYNYKKYTS